MSSSGHPEDLAGGKGGLELLQADLAELENSIQHLIRSNNELSKVCGRNLKRNRVMKHES